MPEQDDAWPSPWPSHASPLPFARASVRVPARMPVPPTDAPPRAGWANLRDSLADAGDLIAAPIRALVGRPEDAASPDLPSALSNLVGGQNVETPNSRQVLGGAADLAMALPMFGTSGRAAESVIEGVRPFMSKLWETVAERAPERGIAEHFLNVARKGSKAEELSWSGLEQYLRERSGQKVEKSDVLDYIRQNTPDLRERMIGETGPVINGRRRPPFTHDENGAVVIPQQPKFTQYTLPGGENHRELVVMMPSRPAAPSTVADERHFDDWLTNGYFYNGEDMATGEMLPAGMTARQHFDSMPVEDRADIRYDYRINGQDDLPEHVTPGGNYQVPAGHAYGDPELDVNRLMHMRFNDRTTAAGERVLHLDELQSDWHQAGRKSGYQGVMPKVPEGYTMSRATADGTDEFGNAYKNGDWIIGDSDNAELSAPGNKSQVDALKHMASDEPENGNGPIFGEHAGGTFTSGVPDAPFKNTWHELGMRRALQQAAADGKDMLTWTTGTQQNARYSLSKVFSKLEYDPVARKLTGYNLTGEPTLDRLIEPADLPSYVGRDLADRLTAPVEPSGHEVVKGDDQFWHVKTPGGQVGARPFMREDQAQTWIDQNFPRKNAVEGDKLEAGGEGMRGFYDRMLPSYADKFGRRYGVGPELTQVKIGADKNAILSSLRAAQYSGVAQSSPHINEALMQIAHDVRNNGMTVEEAYGKFKSGHQINAQVKLRIEDLLNKLPKVSQEPVWSLRITPEMRRDLLGKSQPLFGGSPVPVPLPTRRDDDSSSR